MPGPRDSMLRHESRFPLPVSRLTLHSSPRFRRYGQSHALTVPQDHDLCRLADFQGVHGVGVIVDIGDLLPAVLARLAGRWDAPVE